MSLAASQERTLCRRVGGSHVQSMSPLCPAWRCCCPRPQYLRVFQLLWRLKRAEASLAGCWTTLQCTVHRTLAGMQVEDGERGPQALWPSAPQRSLGVPVSHARTEQSQSIDGSAPHACAWPAHMRARAGVGAADELSRRCLRLRADMSHFVTNLQYYLMFEVLEAAWQVRASPPRHTRRRSGGPVQQRSSAPCTPARLLLPGLSGAPGWFAPNSSLARDSLAKRQAECVCRCRGVCRSSPSGWRRRTTWTR